jgi:hypothetical protein
VEVIPTNCGIAVGTLKKSARVHFCVLGSLYKLTVLPAALGRLPDLTVLSALEQAHGLHQDSRYDRLPER